jgi:hypothetical protein
MKVSLIKCPSFRVLISIAASFVLSAPFATNCALGARKALVIGNSQYVYLNRLTNPVRDADLMERVLTALNFSVIKRSDLGSADLKRTLADFCGTLSRGDAAVIYYSGHGYQYLGQSRLVPIDYNPAKVTYDFEVRDETLSLDDILNAVSTPGATPKIVILDACRNLLPIPANARSPGQMGLADVHTPDDETLVCYSTKDGTVAVDDSAYGPILAEEIAKPGKTIDIVMREVTRRVKNATNGKQLPWTYGNLTQDFYFNPSGDQDVNPGPISTPMPIITSRQPPPPPPPTLPPVPDLQDFIRASWRHYTSNDPSDWASDFAPSVNYCYYERSGFADRSFVERDRNKLVNSYPVRHYQFSGLGVQFESDGRSARVHYSYSYSYNGKKAASGTARVSLTVQLLNGQWFITDFDESVNRNG